MMSRNHDIAQKSSTLTRNHALIWMVLILLLAAVFYSFRLTLVSFWEDESWLAIGISGSPLDLWTHSAELGVHPPLYFYIVYLLKPLMGTSELILRWQSGVFGLLGIAWTYRLLADMTDRRTALLGAFLVSGSILLMYMARMARHYTLFYLLCVLLMWAYWRYRSTGRGAWLIALSCGAALWTHYFSAFVALTIALHALITQPIKRTRIIWLALIIGGVLFIPWMPAILTQLNAEHGDGLFYGVFTVRAILDNFAGRMGNATLWFMLGFSLLGVVALIHDRRWTLLILLTLWIPLTLFLIIAVNQMLFVWYIGRNMLYALPAFALLYAYGLAWLWRFRGGRWLSIGLACSFVIYGAAAFPYYWFGTPDWRGLTDRIADDVRVEDTILINGEPYSLDYYLTRALGERPTVTRIESLNDALTDANRIWLVDDTMQISPRLLGSLPDGMQQTRQLDHDPMRVAFWQRPPQTITATFDDQIALGYNGVDTLTVSAGERITLDVWWQALRAPDFNYSAGFLLTSDEGSTITQTDGNFNWIDAQVLPVGAWSPDARTLTIPPQTASGTYTLYVTVYDWRDNTRLPLNDQTEDIFPLVKLVVKL